MQVNNDCHEIQADNRSLLCVCAAVGSVSVQQESTELIICQYEPVEQTALQLCCGDYCPWASKDNLQSADDAIYASHDTPFGKRMEICTLNYKTQLQYSGTCKLPSTTKNTADASLSLLFSFLNIVNALIVENQA